MIKTAIFSAIAVAASAQSKAACKNNHLSWKTSWGACPTYAKGKMNYNWCKWDKSGGLYAKEVCPQCGTCASTKKVKKTAFPTRFPTAFPTALVCNSKTYNSVWGKCSTYTFGKPNHNYCKSDVSKHMKSCTADKACKECVKPSFGMCKANPAQKWNAGWGLCATYAKGKANNFWCDKDQKDGVYAHEACAECNLCTAETDAKSCKDWNCAQWCQYYDSKFDAIYAEAGCNDDGEECKCDKPKVEVLKRFTMTSQKTATSATQAWQHEKEFCESKGGRLPTFEEMCPSTTIDGKGDTSDSAPALGCDSGHSWMPYSKDSNSWVFVGCGGHGGKVCKDHVSHHSYANWASGDVYGANVDCFVSV